MEAASWALVKPKILLPLILFILTIVTTTVSGALFEGANPFSNPASLVKGIPFSASLILILGTHELAHYFASRRHRVFTTYPHFIPGPPLPPMIGTFGAVIKIKSPITTKNALVDIGASGPLAGFIVAIGVMIWGLKSTWLIPEFTTLPFEIGDTLIFLILTKLVLGSVPEGYKLFIHPVIFAGWIGFFITSINLLPIGQLDGGHITYAVLGKLHRKISIAMVPILVVLGYFTWPGWILWAVLVSVLGLRHPPTHDSHIPLDSKRKVISTVSLLVFILTFTPTPFYIR